MRQSFLTKKKMLENLEYQFTDKLNNIYIFLLTSLVYAKKYVYNTTS